MEEPVIYYGSCLCGGITYTLTGEPEQVVACYCSHCQKNAGSKYQIFAKYPSSSIDIEDPSDSMRYYTITKGTESGLPKEKHFCGNCGCTLWTVPWKHGGDIKLVRTSLIENGLAHFKPKAEIHKGQWTSDAL
ncbi:uncharacterized protein E0L32_010386 [Thyridium curvatum]|uniref:CENP-V/GFA domain-containing protein n=1 Tax=Thyridium curvatum TaxID=1093900 RepID=A0A507ASP6_9PEZI|nr:uncharacterized protein E0L32_010386 [Thyridium curvatum]TPX07931.1 hypothetical protein E0L32_010386 [Thyridium curvatum]